MTKNLMAQGDIAGRRREKVALFKKIFTFVKIFGMAALSIVGSMYFIWNTYLVELGTKYLELASFNGPRKSLMSYIEAKPFLYISCFLISVIACSFVAFLVLHGIQNLVVKIMMRKANTGK